MRGTPSKPFRLLLAVGILSSCIGCDQVTKKIATESLQDRPAQTFLRDTIRLEYALNPGGFLSLGSNLPAQIRYWLFISVDLVFMLLIAGFLLVRWKARLTVFTSLVCLLAGGIGNLIDRATQNGLVTDFMNVGIGPVRSGIFNVADVALVFGAITLVMCLRSGDGDRRRMMA